MTQRLTESNWREMSMTVVKQVEHGVLSAESWNFSCRAFDVARYAFNVVPTFDVTA